MSCCHMISVEMLIRLGLRVYPSLVPPEAQMLFLSSVMHRDLANPNHKTNINVDYHVPEASSRTATSPSRPAPNPSFFAFRQASKDQILTPKDPSSKLKPLNMSQFLQKKLRWLTLGDQYEWKTRSYSGEDITPFPPDIAQLVEGLFPGLRPESGVVLLYSKTDYMPMHRDVSEVCETGLASFSLGCDGLFIVAGDTKEGDDGKEGKTVVIRVRSGDVVQMSGETRWAWHAMPKIIPGTCPEFMERWPAGSEFEMGEKEYAYEQWRGYMAGKRINISCRQVWN
jgi:alkylated DNA repair protein alkB family protein 1